MFMGTSLSQSIPPWPSATVPSFYMPSSPPTPPAATTISNAQILPFPAPTAAGSAAPVVINLQADVTISRYDQFYDAPLPSFRPTYYAMADGSLLSQAYVDEMTVSKAPVFVAGGLLVFFLRNARKSVLFLRRTRVKDKTLFYLLALSQLLGLVAIVVSAVGLLDMTVGCNTIDAVRKVFTKLSCDAMISGIIGVKAYRCLGNSRLVLLFLLCVTAIMWTLVGLEIANYSAHRSRYGVCQDTGQPSHMSAIILTEFIETAILCACFFLAVWKSCRTRAEARITISAADEGKLYERNDANMEGIPSRRGWWDYVPEAHASSTNGGRPYLCAMMHALKEWISRLWSDDDFPAGIAYQRKPSLPGEFPLPQPSRRSAPGRISSRSAVRRFTQFSSLPWVSVTRRWGHHFFGRQLFQQMLRNELLYTTMITGIFMALAIALLVGIHSNPDLGAEQWITLNWIIISLFTMHSFSRVVRRHELESVLQHPAAWDRMLRTDGDYSEVFYGPGPHRTRSSRNSSSPSPARIQTNRPGEGVASFFPNHASSQDVPFSSYAVSPITPSSSRKPSAASSLPSLHFQQLTSPHDSPPRSPAFDTLTPLPYPPSSPTASSPAFRSTHTQTCYVQPRTRGHQELS
ncbi:uncharacterized protein B0H18DRAFT_1113380 [Fomitopsis serialis]|uniref:uncharacterized protein n=1 Tax=Fomitopsis serialis TaxID=139415 RepID=UPI002008A041|nr:uncharacterized protein B0H18DRAFT_1113380 [Neoantrodia serialis]KAH9937563.1 hypothetical protein B0H18DRAFT_1113380 [Neoantrodia serialis]